MHIHADVIENGRFTERRECLTGESALNNGKDWLANEITKDFQDYAESSESPARPIRKAYVALSDDHAAWSGESEAWEGSVNVGEHGNPPVSIVMGYRLMWIDGDCDRTI